MATFRIAATRCASGSCRLFLLTCLTTVNRASLRLIGGGRHKPEAQARGIARFRTAMQPQNVPPYAVASATRSVVTDVSCFHSIHQPHCRLAFCERTSGGFATSSGDQDWRRVAPVARPGSSRQVARYGTFEGLDTTAAEAAVDVRRFGRGLC